MAEPPEEFPATQESFQALHADLLALSETRLLSVERLEDQLRAHINDFRALLEKKPRSDQSRAKLATGAHNPLLGALN
jgi:nuclear pore complex protein Nup205